MAKLKHILAALLIASHSAQAESLTRYMTGTCDGQDAPQNHPSQIVEFASAFQVGAPPVYVTGIQTRIMPMAGALEVQYLFAGDNDEPDVMAWGDQCRDGRNWCIDAAVNPPMKWGRSHVDLHLSCTPAGATWQAFYTVYFTLTPP